MSKKKRERVFVTFGEYPTSYYTTSDKVKELLYDLEYRLLRLEEPFKRTNEETGEEVIDEPWEEEDLRSLARGIVQAKLHWGKPGLSLKVSAKDAKRVRKAKQTYTVEEVPDVEDDHEDCFPDTMPYTPRATGEPLSSPEDRIAPAATFNDLLGSLAGDLAEEAKKLKEAKAFSPFGRDDPRSTAITEEDEKLMNFNPHRADPSLGETSISLDGGETFEPKSQP